MRSPRRLSSGRNEAGQPAAGEGKPVTLRPPEQVLGLACLPLLLWGHRRSWHVPCYPLPGGNPAQGWILPLHSPLEKSASDSKELSESRKLHRHGDPGHADCLLTCRFRKLLPPASCFLLPFLLLPQEGCEEGQSWGHAEDDAREDITLPSGQESKDREDSVRALPRTTHRLGPVTWDNPASPTIYLQDTWSYSHFAVWETEARRG